jgi:hypothetical protein
MGPLGMQAGFRQILPLLAIWTGISFTTVFAQSGQPVNEGGTTESEPHVILSENKAGVPARNVSKAVIDSADPLVKLVWETRDTQRHRLLSTKDHTPWQIMHGVLGLRQDFLISHNGQAVNGLEWIQSGPLFQNESWFEKTQYGGRAHPFSKPYWFEGHVNQFLAILATCNLPLETTFQTPGGPITMKEMLKNAQMTVNSREEVTWTLWALATYLPSDATWVNAAGEQWSIEKLVQIETGKKVGGPTSPCGGTHGLFALARARNVYLRTGKPLRGAWFEADQKIKKYIEVARVLRNTDGSLSSGFFKTREFKQDFDKRMASEGHLLEFLMMSVSQEQLKEAWIRRAIEATANDLMANRREYVSCSPLYHATNALSIYLDRTAQESPEKVAEKPPATKSATMTKELPPTRNSAPAVKNTTTADAAVQAPAKPAESLNVPMPSGEKPAPITAPPQPAPAATSQPSAAAPGPETPNGPTPTPAPAAGPGSPAASGDTPVKEPIPGMDVPSPVPPLTPAPTPGASASTRSSSDSAVEQSLPQTPVVVSPNSRATATLATPNVPLSTQQTASPSQPPVSTRPQPLSGAGISERSADSLPLPLKSIPRSPTPRSMRADSSAPMPPPSAGKTDVRNPLPLPGLSSTGHSPAAPPVASESRQKLPATPAQITKPPTKVEQPVAAIAAPAAQKKDSDTSKSAAVLSLGDFLGGASLEPSGNIRAVPGSENDSNRKTGVGQPTPAPAATLRQGPPAGQPDGGVNPKEKASLGGPAETPGTMKRPLKTGTPFGQSSAISRQGLQGRVTPASATRMSHSGTVGSEKASGGILRISGSGPIPH